MDFKALVRPLRRNDVLGGIVGGVVIGIAIGVLGDEIYYRKIAKVSYTKDIIDEVDVAESRLMLDLEKSRRQLSEHMGEVKSAFTNEMERMMDEFTAQLRTAANMTEARDREAIEAAEETVGRVSVFTTSHDEEGGDIWDYEVELASRDPNEPYIIHREEYDANENNWPQSTLTYYAGDDVLTDEKDKPVNPYLPLTGHLAFGHGSQDQSIVYVRNEKMQAEWEILLDHGKYVVEILGQDIEAELTHAHTRKQTPKFRQE